MMSPALLDKKHSIAGLRREPRHIALAREIRAQVQQGELQPGDRLPSFDDLRERWGVGRDTLERMYKLLEGDGLVVREHRRGVFITDAKPPMTGTVGFVNAPRLHNHPYYMHLLAGVREEAQKSGFEVLLLDRETSIRWEKVDGVIYQATMGRPLTAELRLPQVSLVYARSDIDCATADDYSGMSEAVEHLWELGHRRIAFLTSERSSRVLSHQRISAYFDVLRVHGQEVQADCIRFIGDPAEEHKNWEELGREDMREWLDDNWNSLGCTAIITQNDETAVGVIQALTDAGLQVPQDVSVVGFDGTEIAQYHRPRLTTVKVPLKEIGARGFQLLMQQLKEPVSDSLRLPVKMVLPTKLAIGETTVQPAGSI